ncbi:hypothetical protein CWI42_040100 [Ordospora colligata]|uniref:Uncharacterized protein n=1 Tax=Ordospora colligata OC4 TaxID=1354746 RepID=A0A0B2UKG3_9MICR|nr:uncharacterized protein M896_040100 [Ordospora colligata OC4]KHN69818.1 hypothetical protein M896_040100 [Ordospora colligata OC4]TBU15988.1 hypothetical protein CWI41_040100 [Ordospora colligata]TBU16201.1 hypothetical protein CWI40_040100 [Ordospora colligata]TBU18905.1 hypothetical protein CWI42_040100 [Ordospora colligata]
MSVYLDKVKRIINNFEGDDRNSLVSHCILVSRDVLLDDREVKRAKLDVVTDLYSIIVDDADALLDEVLSHKILQVRALILDLVDNDYSVDYEDVGMPERWIRKIVEDTRDTFDFESEFGMKALLMYNKKLLDEFCAIFVSTNKKFGSNGNQLLLNFYYYKKEIGTKACEASKDTNDDFEEFFNTIKQSFRSDMYKTVEELEEILREQ